MRYQVSGLWRGTSQGSQEDDDILQQWLCQVINAFRPGVNPLTFSLSGMTSPTKSDWFTGRSRWREKPLVGVSWGLNVTSVPRLSASSVDLAS